MTVLPVVASLALVAALSFRGGGYIVPSATVPVVCWLAICAGWVIAQRPGMPSSRWLWVALAALVLSAVWTGASIIWSVGPDLSWVAFDYAALYAAVLAALAWGGCGPVRLRIATVGYLVCVVAVGVAAYLGKVVPDVVTHANKYARLADPVGYWNVLAIMLVMAVPVALALSARRGLHPLLRALSAAVLAFLVLTLFFTFSRGGFAAAIVVVVVYFAATKERLSSLVSLLCAAVPVGVVLYSLRGLETLFGATTDAALRTAQGRTLAWWTIAVVCVPFAAQLAVALVHARLRLGRAVQRWVGVAVSVAILSAVVVGPLVYLQGRGGVVQWTRTQYRSFIGAAETEDSDTAGRLLIVSSNGRVSLYREALDQVRYTPVLGTGAGTFAFTNYRFRDSGLVVKHAHSQWFNALSELGYPGLALLVVFALALTAAMVGSLVRHRRDAERGLLAAAAAAAAGFLFHISGDWDWDMAASTVAFLLLGVAVAVYRRDAAQQVAKGVTPGQQVAEAGATVRGAAAQRRLSWPVAGMWVGLLAVLAVSWIVPALALQAEERALAAATAGRMSEAAAQAQRARRLNPLAVDPLITLAAVQSTRGRPRAALELLEEAKRLQPENAYVHYRLGLLLATDLGRVAEARTELQRALQLNPLHAPSRTQLELLGGG